MSGLQNIRPIFGIHSWTPFNINDGLPYGTVECLHGSTLGMKGETVKLQAGAYRWPWDVQDGFMSAECSIKLASYEDFLFELFMGKAPTTSSTDTTGTVGTLTNVKGTSCMVATTGIASVGIKTSSNAQLKFGKYIVKVASATTVNVYCYSSVDFARGTDLTFQDDDCKVTSAALTITQSAAVEIPNTGCELTGGSGTIGMTVGDTATFTVKPPSTRSYDVTIGASSDTFPAFGSWLSAEKLGQAEYFDIELLRCKGIGLPIVMEEKKHSEAEIKFECYQKSASDGVMNIRSLTASTLV